MADNNSSNIVAIFAIIVIVIIALGAFYYFSQGNLKETGIAPSTPSVNVNVTKVPNPAKK